MYLQIFSFILTILIIFLVHQIKRVHKCTIKRVNEKEWQLTNFGLTYKWISQQLFSPSTKEEIIVFLKNREKNNIKEIRAIGALHSWSACAKTTGVTLDTSKLTNILNVDKKNMQITAEAGIKLSDLYASMKKNQMAIGSMANVQVITLGGAISNGAHGTNIKYGTMSSLVYAIELIDASGKVHNLTRDSQDPKIQNYFDAALVSFGSLGVIYSITLQCEEEYNMINIRSIVKKSELKEKGKFVKLYNSYESIYSYIFPESDEILMRINTRAPLLATNSIALPHYYTFKDRQLQDIMLFCMKKLKFSRKYFGKLIPNAFNYITCVIWDKYELVDHTQPFVNMEYTVKQSKIEEAIEIISNIFQNAKKQKIYNRDLAYVIRGVGRDDRGFLSITRDDNKDEIYYCIDIPYQNDVTEAEKKVFFQIEEKLLELGGRCNFARLFWNQNKAILQNCWDKGGVKWKKVKLELDPHHVFTNEFVKKIFFEESK